VINITGNFLNRILELFNTVDTISAPSMSGILKLAILSTIDILTILSKQMNKPYQQSIDIFIIIRSTRSAYVTPGDSSKKSKKKGKAVPLHAMEAHWGRGGIAPTHS
jgi:hypothetical protein